MLNNPLISVIIPTHNRGAILGRAIDSVLAQSYGNIEVIVVDDGSNDDSEAVVRSILDARLSYIRLDKNLGGAMARNIGIRAAKGEYIAFQDSDDEWVPDKLEKQLQVFDSPGKNFGVIYSGFLIIGDNYSRYMPPGSVEKKEGYIYEQLLMENFVGTPTLLVKKEVFDRVGVFDGSLPRYHDWELAIRMAAEYEFGFIDEPLVRVHASPVSISAEGITRIKAREILLKKHFAGFSRNSNLLARHFRDLGHFKCVYESCSSGRVFLLKAIQTKPTYLSALLAYLLSFAGKWLYRKIYFNLYKKVA